MILDHRGDIFEANINGLLQSCNLHRTFGSGLAAQIKVRFPEAYEADLKTKDGDYHKLGTFSYANIDNFFIFNIYSQIGFRTVGTQCATHYPSVFAGMISVKEFIENYRFGYFNLGIPYKYGSGLGGGSWPTIMRIIEKVFDGWVKSDTHNVLICRRNGD